MIRIAASLLLVAALAGCTSNGSPVNGPDLGDVSSAKVEDAVEKVKPALVRIKVVEPSYYDGRESKQVGYGSGTIIDAQGHVVTNHHVAGKAVQLLVTMPNREEVRASLVGTDPATDIAVIKLEPEKPSEFYFANFGDSDKIKVGDPVLALGSPLSLSQSVTLGILANSEMIAPAMYRDSGYEFELDGENVGDLVRWFGHDAAIFPGNSGGPLVNLDGEIIGVNEIGMGLGGAIPGNLAKSVADELIEKGFVKRAYFGFSIQPLLRSIDGEGVLVASVLKDSPAEKSGLRPGDILQSVNGKTISAHFQEELPPVNIMLARLPIGEPATVTFRRNGAEQQVTVAPEEREPALLPTTEMKEWGLTARNLSRWTQIDLALESKQGVLVTSTRSGGPSSKAKPELRIKDVIVSVNGEKVNTVEQLKELTGKLVTGQDDYVPALVEFERGGELLMTVVEVGLDQLQDPARDVEKSWLPMETQVITREIAQELGMPDVQGVRVTRVYETAPAGFPFKVGDLITELDEMPIEASRTVDADVFETMVRQYKIGSEVPLVVLRDKQEQTVTVKFGGSPEKIREMPRYRDLVFEFVVRGATFEDRNRPALEGVDFDVVIDGVTSGGWADLAGLKVGDALIEIDGSRITSIDQVEALMKTAQESKPDHIVFFVRRGAQNVYLEVEPNWE